jgi:hypothetical protein
MYNCIKVRTFLSEGPIAADTEIPNRQQLSKQKEKPGTIALSIFRILTEREKGSDML